MWKFGRQMRLVNDSVIAIDYRSVARNSSSKSYKDAVRQGPGERTLHHLHILAQMQICPLLTGSRASAPITSPLHAQYTLFGPSPKRNLVCCLLSSMVACSLVPCTSREWSSDMVHNNCLDYPDGRTEKRCHLLHDFTTLS
jgi:hypothetical protein